MEVGEPDAAAMRDPYGGGAEPSPPAEPEVASPAGRAPSGAVPSGEEAPSGEAAPAAEPVPMETEVEPLPAPPPAGEPTGPPAAGDIPAEPASPAAGGAKKEPTPTPSGTGSPSTEAGGLEGAPTPSGAGGAPRGRPRVKEEPGARRERAQSLPAALSVFPRSSLAALASGQDPTSSVRQQLFAHPRTTPSWPKSWRTLRPSGNCRATTRRRTGPRFPPRRR